MDENRDRGINENDRTVDVHQGTTGRSCNKSTFSEDVHGSENDPFLHSPSQPPSPDGFPGLSGNNEKRGPRSDLASDFWSRGVANWGALHTRSKDNEMISDSNALIKESGNPLTKRDTAETARNYSRAQIYRSGILSFLGSDSTSAASSGAGRPVPDSSVTVFDEIHEHKKEPPGPSSRNPLEITTLDVEACDQSLEPKAKGRPSTIPPSVWKSPTEPCGGKEHDSLTGADAMSLHTGCAGSTITSNLETETESQGLSITGQSKPAIPTGPRFSDRAYSCPGWGSGPSLPKRLQSSYTPPESSQVPKHNNDSSAKATTHISEPRPVTPITPTRNLRIRHPKALSAEAPAFHPSPSSSSPNTPTRIHSNGHGRSVSSGSGQLNPSYLSVMPNTRLRQRNWFSRQASMGTPSVPKVSGGAYQPFVNPQYPEPHQHTPEGQGQCFDTQGSMLPIMPIQICNFPSPQLPPFRSPMQSFETNSIHYNTQFYEQGEQKAEYPQTNHFDSYATSQTANAAPNAADLHQNGNMYTQDTDGYGPRYYSNHANPSHQVHFCPPRIDYAALIKIQLNQNLYSPLEPHRKPSKPNQRTAKDLFIPEDIRLKLHTRTEATLRVFAGRLF